MYAIDFCSALHGTISGNLFWKPWRDQGRTFQQKALEREHAALVLSLACKNYRICISYNPSLRDVADL